MGRRRLPSIALSFVASLLLCGSRSNCDTRTPTLTCASQNVTVQPGQCVPLANPCGPDWLIQDAFKLCSAPDGLSVTTVRARGVVTRELCAAATMTPIANATVGFIYTNVDDFGENNLIVTVGTPMSVVASATPASIQTGQGSFLSVAVTGGTAPYTYDWSPASTLNDASIADPTAFPITTTTYTVTVTDANGETASGSVTVNVSAALVVTANPSTINLGFSSQLFVTYPSAAPPVSYSWSPNNGTLSNPFVANPIAVPATTTTYTVTVTDANGTVSGSVTVTVNLRVFASANPSVVTPGTPSQLTVAASGGLPPYSYAWTESGGGSTLSDPNIATPVATPSATTTYTVTVTDSAGATASRSVTVTVNGVALNACYTLSPAQPLAGQFFTIDMSCSSGNISIYRVWLNYSAGASPSYASNSPQYTTLVETPATLNNVRIEVEDIGGSTAFIDTSINVQ